MGQLIFVKDFPEELFKKFEGTVFPEDAVYLERYNMLCKCVKNRGFITSETIRRKLFGIGIDLSNKKIEDICRENQYFIIESYFREIERDVLEKFGRNISLVIDGRSGGFWGIDISKNKNIVKNQKEMDYEKIFYIRI